MKLHGDCKNCFYKDSCDENKIDTTHICDYFHPLSYTEIDVMGVGKFEELYGYGGALRIGE